MAHEEHPTAPNNTPAPQQSPVRTLRSQAEDARAYRREHDLCECYRLGPQIRRDCISTTFARMTFPLASNFPPHVLTVIRLLLRRQRPYLEGLPFRTP